MPPGHPALKYIWQVLKVRYSKEGAVAVYERLKILMDRYGSCEMIK
jgi:hypothetical protein